jgi:hypothetical protein
MTYRIVLDVDYERDYAGEIIHWSLLKPTYIEIGIYKKWCEDHVGVNNWNYYGQHKKIPFEFRFRYSEDLLAFKMKFIL